MKRTILILVFAIFTMSYCLATDSTLVTGTNTEKLMDKYIGQATEAIKALAETLKQPAEFVYSTLVEQTVREGYLMIWIPIIIFVFCILVFLFLQFVEWKFDWDSDGVEFFKILFLVLAGITFFVGCFAVTGGILRVNNPDYYAIRELLSFFQ